MTTACGGSTLQPESDGGKSLSQHAQPDNKSYVKLRDIRQQPCHAAMLLIAQRAGVQAPAAVLAGGCVKCSRMRCRGGRKCRAPKVKRVLAGRIVCRRCERPWPAASYRPGSWRCRLCRIAVSNENSGRLGHLQRRRVGDALSDAQWLAILRAYKGLCAYCGAPWQVMEHRIPVVKGGGHGPDNVVPACSLCNGRKGSKVWEVRSVA